MAVKQENPKPIRPSSFNINPSSHTSDARIETSFDVLPIVAPTDIAQGVSARLPQTQVRAISLTQVQEITEIHVEGEEARTQTVTRTTLSTDPAALSGQTIAVFRGNQEEYGAGSFVEVPAATLLLKQLRQFSHQAGIVATGGVDNLIAPHDPNYDRFTRSMQATDGVAIAMANGLIPQHIVRIFGPAARGTEDVQTAEIYDAVAYNPHSTTHRRHQISVGKALRLDETGAVHMSLYPSLARDILTHHTWVSSEAFEEDPAQQPFVLVIEGGDGKNSVEDAIQAELQARGIKNASWIIHAQGEDLRVQGAILRDLPDQNGVRDLEHLGKLQQQLDFVGGSMTVTGSMTPHHPDGALFTQTGKRYTRHEHGIGQAPDGTNRGGHINATILGGNSRAYIVIRPIRDVVEVDASLTIGTQMEAMKLPGAAEHELVLKSIAFRNMGNEVIKAATNLNLTAAQVESLYMITKGNLSQMINLMTISKLSGSFEHLPILQQLAENHNGVLASEIAFSLGLSAQEVESLFTMTAGNVSRMIQIMQSNSFKMNLLVQRQAQTERILQEGRQLLAELESERRRNHPPTPQILNLETTPWSQISDQIMHLERKLWGENADEELNELIEDPTAVTVILRETDDPDSRIIGYAVATAKTVENEYDREQNESDEPADQPGDEHIAYVWSLTIDPIFPSLTRGKALISMMELLEQELRQREFTSIELDTFPTLAARIAKHRPNAQVSEEHESDFGVQKRVSYPL